MMGVVIIQSTGAPDKVVISSINALVERNDTDSYVTVSITVTDNSLAPARRIIYNMKVTIICC